MSAWRTASLTDASGGRPATPNEADTGAPQAMARSGSADREGQVVEGPPGPDAEDAELVAADAGHHGAGGRGLAPHRGERLQEVVAGVVTEGVVHAREMVDIGHEDLDGEVLGPVAIPVAGAHRAHGGEGEEAAAEAHGGGVIEGPRLGPASAADLDDLADVGQGGAGWSVRHGSTMTSSVSHVAAAPRELRVMVTFWRPAASRMSGSTKRSLGAQP